MKNHFGTDGIRGIVNDGLDHNLAFKVGNALTCIKSGAKVLIGKDTRLSGDMLYLSLAAGITAGGGDVHNLCVMPTAGVAYLTKKAGADFGIVVSASHNPKEYNGIKIFGSDGYKLPDATEMEIESKFGIENFVENARLGRIFNFEEKHDYEKALVGSVSTPLSGLKVVLDLANGAAYDIAPRVFRAAGAEVVTIYGDGRSGNINENCGATCTDAILSAAKEHSADVGLSFDGDSDRLIACDSKGNLFNGDAIIYMFARYYKKKGLLTNNTVVGTLHTNMGAEDAIKRLGINFERSDIGDKYVIELMRKTGSVLGGEQSGHIILGDKSTTGDGILAGLMLCQVMIESGVPLSGLCDFVQYPQININVIVNDKRAIMTSPLLEKYITETNYEIGKNGRVMVRASGTEPKIRVTTECLDEEKAKAAAERLAAKINEIANIAIGGR